ncbi:MAG: gliding motility-associated C-terminal domain-containing protein [Chitinophagales bacterium]
MNRKITFLLSLLFLGFYFPSNGQAPITGTFSLCVGTTTPLSDTDPAGTWSSGTTTVATVDVSTGVVFGVAPGTSVITYATATTSVTATVTVNTMPITGPTTVCQGSTITLSDASIGGSWSSVTPAIATIGSASGVVTGVSGGTVGINYTTSCGIQLYSINVIPLTTAITGTTTVCVGSGISLSDATPGGAWSSSNSTAATVSAGYVSGASPGTTTISYSNGCGTASIVITVNQTPTPIAGLTSFCNGSTSFLTSSPAGVWSTTNPAIATVSPSGTLTGTGVGSTFVCYTLADGCSVCAPVTVSNCPPCPPNSNFEFGNYTIWHYFAGTCCPINTPTTCTVPPSGPAPCAIPNRFALTGPAPGVINGVDPWGLFPVVGEGVYSLRIGTCETLYHASKAAYFIHVPTTVGTYALIYRYAVVMEDPGHSAASQPRFTVQAFDVTTAADTMNGGTIIPCANFNYVAGSLPGFAISTGPHTGCPGTFGPNGGSNVYYKPWATTSINLTGLGGHTIRMNFAAGDCGLGGHFGYGYVDMTCGTFAISSMGCGDTVATLSAPSGFANYMWYDSATFLTLYGTTQTIVFPMPGGITTYAVIMSPYPGFGCPDTLYTTIRPSNLQTHPHSDTSICAGQSVTLSSGATDVALPLTYSWTPGTGLSCTTCATPIATPPAGMNVYTVLVTDDANCQKTAIQRVFVDSVAATIAATDTRCFDTSDGKATVTVTSGTGPYSYSWNTVPVQTTSTAINLAIGTYVVNITDSKGCTNSQSTTIAQPPPLTMSIGGTTNPTKCDTNDGTIRLTGFPPIGAGITDTIRYLFTATGSATVVTTTVSLTITAGTTTITGLSQGTYDSITVVTSGCPYNELGPIVLVDPPLPALPYVTSNSPICDSTTLNLTTTDVTPGVTYSWSGPGGFTSTSQTPTRTPAPFADTGWYVVTVMVNNCKSKDSTHVMINAIPKPVAANNSQICSGDTLKLTSSAPGGADAYLWNGPNGYISNLQNPWIINAGATASGTYTVAITYKGCTGIDSTIAIINPVPEPPGVVDTNYCQLSFPPLYLAPQLTAAGTNLLWYTSPTTLMSSSVAPTPSTATDGITTWYVTQTSNTAPPCTSPRAPISVGIYAFPHPQFVISDSVYCQGTYFTFNVTGANTGADYQGLTWNFGNGDSVQNVNPILHAFGISGSTTVSVSVYYKVCPDTTLSHPILVYPYPLLHLGPDTTICPGSESIQIGDHENDTNRIATWLWNTSETTSAITIVAPGTFYVKVTINGCSTSDTIIVEKDCYMDIPNVFTPNGDGVNDYFYPRQYLTRGLTTFNMTIYNRWGQVVFQTTTLDGRGWDGTFNGVPQPEGVFVYLIDATFKDGQKEHHQGNVTLLR